MIQIKTPWRFQPPRGATPKADFIHDARGYNSASGSVINAGTMPVTVETVPSVQSTLITTPYGQGVRYPGTVGQTAKLDYPAFCRAGDPFTALTVGCWLKCSDTGDDQQICGQYASTAGQAAWRFELDVGGGNLYLNLSVDAEDDTSISLTGSPVGIVNDGGYHHCVGVIYLDSANLLNIEGYFDGRLVMSNTHSSTGWNTGAASNNLFEIGERGGGDPEPFNGDIIGLFVDRKRWPANRIASAYVNHWGELYEPRTQIIPLEAAATSVIITSVSGDDAWTDGDTSIPIVGTGFV
jgi:hypothetical protein